MIAWFVIGFLAGAAVGAAVVLIVSAQRGASVQRQMRDTFAALAGEALDANARRLAEQTSTSLDGKKELIDQSVQAINERLEAVRQYLQHVEAQRREDFGQLGQSVASLSATAGKLHEMLASTQRRGAWGERMAQDVLNLAGLQEGVNYVRQSSADADSGRADFTFLLPNELKVNLDVKFPLESYKAYLDAADDAGRSACLKDLCRAVTGHVRAVASRGYIDPHVPTVPYVLVFIPSEQIYSLVLQAQADLIDQALALRVVLCSPLTLYAELAIMRQAAENFNVMKTADEIVALLGEFRKQWGRYGEELERLGQRIEAAGKQYEVVRTTRTNMLQRPLDQIEQLRTARGLPQAGQDTDGPP